MEAPGGTGKSAGEGEEAVSQRLGAQGRPGKSESVHPQAPGGEEQPGALVRLREWWESQRPACGV